MREEILQKIQRFCPYLYKYEVEDMVKHAKTISSIQKRKDYIRAVVFNIEDNWLTNSEVSTICELIDLMEE